jgi:hypothetical protein
VIVEWNLGAKTMTFKKKTEEEPPKKEGKDMEEKLKGQEEHLSQKSIEAFNKSFDEQLARNKLFYEKAKDWIAENYYERYVVIANGALLSVHDDYDSALERSASLKHRFAHRMVFKAGETPFFGKEKIYPPRVTDTAIDSRKDLLTSRCS